MKDCFGLHGHSAFCSVAKGKIGVGRKSVALSDGHTTDPFNWLQAGKTVPVVRFASKIHRLASAFRTASVASQPAAMPTRPAMPATVTSSPSPRPPSPWLADYRLAPVIVLPFVIVMIVLVLVLMLIVLEEPNCKDRCAVAYLLGIVVLLLVILYYMEKRLTALLPVLGGLRFLIIQA